MTSAVEVLFLDHSGQPGGGQLGLERAWHLEFRNRSHVAFLTGGDVAKRMHEADPARVHVRLEDQDFSPRRHLLPALPWILRLLRRIKPDVIVVNSAAAAKALAPALPLLRVPAIYYARTDLSADSVRPLKRSILAHAVYRRFDALITNSRWTWETLPEALKVLPTEVAYPVSGFSAPHPTVSETEPHDPLDFVVVSLSRLEPWKGQEHLVRAVASAASRLESIGQRITLELYGGAVLADLDYARRLEAVAAQLQAPVEFKGHVSDVDPVLRRADALVLSSIRPEPFGQVVVQALGHGLVTIVPQAGGPQEIIRHDIDGLTYPPGDTDALTEILVRAAVDTALRARLARSGRQRAATFADSTTAPALARAIDLLTQRVARRS